MTDGGARWETVNDGTIIGGGRGTETEGVVDRECHLNGPEGPGWKNEGERGGGDSGHRLLMGGTGGTGDDGLKPKGGVGLGEGV